MPVAVASTALAALLLAACQETEPRDLGFTEGASQDLAGDVTQPFYASSDDFLGRWIGQAQEPLALTDDGETRVYHFPSGSSQFALDIASRPDGFGGVELTGHITFGAGEPLPPPTDPDVGYPVGFSYLEAFSYGANSIAGNPDTDLAPFEGFSYAFTIEHVRTDGESIDVPDGVLDLTYSLSEPLDPWCQLQTPYPTQDPPSPVDDPYSYSCVDVRGSDGISVNGRGADARCEITAPSDTSACPENPTLEERLECEVVVAPLAVVNCDKLMLCERRYCECNSVACGAAGAVEGLRTYSVRDRLRVRRSGDELVGIFDGTFLNARNYKVPLGEVRFQRVE